MTITVPEPGLAPDVASRELFALERRYDPSFVARLALREKQVQQSYRPMIGIHKWFARRPGTLFRGLLLGEFGSGPLAEDYWRGHDVPGVVVDPFMGGGTTIYEAIRLGLSVVGFDVNPMAYWLVRQGVENLDITEFRAAGKALWDSVRAEIGALYETRCRECSEIAEAKYFFWVKYCTCPECGSDVSLFPGYRIAESVRHPLEVYHCSQCDCLKEVEKTANPSCPDCGTGLRPGNVTRGLATCGSCVHSFRFAAHLDMPPRHRLIGIEYQCAGCYAGIKGRQFKTPDPDDHERVSRAEAMLKEREDSFHLPSDEIPKGDESDRLHRWGYRRYRELFNDRQLLGLGHLREAIAAVRDVRLRNALATVFSDFLRYQNLLCRYDTYALKCQDIFSVHGFPVGLIACENNLLGIPKVGSGSFIHFVEKYARAKQYAQEPYETRHDSGRKVVVKVLGETAEASLVHEQPSAERQEAWLECQSSQTAGIRPRSLDGAFTDPPYFDNVQYAELMDFCFVWLRTLLAGDVPAFTRSTTRSQEELTGNETLSRDLAHFASGLSEVFTTTANGLKEGAPLVFTYHHNEPSAYMPLIVAILDAGLTCTAVLPAPAEMAASLHIAGTKSSILDSVFVCRDREFVENHADSAPPVIDVLDAVDHDVAAMARADYKCTLGDVLCLRAGHMAAAVVRELGPFWDKAVPLGKRVSSVLDEMRQMVEVVELTEVTDG